MKKSSRRASKRPRPKNVSPKTAIVRVAPVPEKPWELDSEAVTIIKNGIAKGASDEELKYCLTVARRYKLDPFKQQIWFIKRWDSSADNGQGGKGNYVWSPQVGINGLLFMAARDHKDFGSVSLPDYGPMQKPDGASFMAPEWARVKVWKKGEPEPTEAQAWWDEYAPTDLAKAPFWRKMPRRMIAKCATALAIRQAYPDLGGVYIPEECEKLNEEFTPSGRQIVEPGNALLYGSHEAAQRVLQAKLAGSMPLHAEEEPKAAPGQPEGVPGARWKKEAEKKADAPPAGNAPPAKTEPWKFSGSITLDYSRDPIIVTGDVQNLFAAAPQCMTAFKWGEDQLWHLDGKNVDPVKKLCVSVNYEIKEIRASSPHPQRQGKREATTSKGATGEGASTSEAPVVVSGTIERTNMGMAGKAPVKYVTLLTASKKKEFLGCFHKSMWDEIEAGLGKIASFVVVKKGKYVNIEKLRQIGSKQWDEEGVPTIQRKDQEAGQRTLY